MEPLPVEIWSHIWRFLDQRQAALLRLVSQQWDKTLRHTYPWSLDERSAGYDFWPAKLRWGKWPADTGVGPVLQKLVVWEITAAQWEDFFRARSSDLQNLRSLDLWSHTIPAEHLGRLPALTHLAVDKKMDWRILTSLRRLTLDYPFSGAETLPSNIQEVIIDCAHEEPIDLSACASIRTLQIKTILTQKFTWPPYLSRLIIHNITILSQIPSYYAPLLEIRHKSARLVIEASDFSEFGPRVLHCPTLDINEWPLFFLDLREFSCRRLIWDPLEGQRFLALYSLHPAVRREIERLLEN